MRLVRLTRWDGAIIWLNPVRVLHVEAARVPEGGGADIVFDTDGGYERVRECPREVAGLMLEPCAP
jgi:hypothetical protein